MQPQENQGIKCSFILLLIMLVSFGLIHANSSRVFAQAPGTIVAIGCDTTWTAADGPHNLTGPLLVDQGVTLTIEPGTTVNLNGYDMQVRGTLVALGTSIAPINITEYIETKNMSPDSNPYGKLEFTSDSNGWNEQLSSGCLFDYVVIEHVDIVSAVSLKISNSRIHGDVTVGDSSIISDSYLSMNNKIANGKITIGSSSEVTNSELTGPTYFENSNLILNNTLKGSVFTGNSNTISYNNISNSVHVGSSCSILNNTINGIIEATDSTVSNNTINHKVSYYTELFTQTTSYTDPGPAIKVIGTSKVLDNIISGQEDYVGIDASFGPFYVSGNTVTYAGTAIYAQGNGTIQRNLLENNTNGIVVLNAGDLTILNNIIVNGTTGISIQGGLVVIEKNLVINHITTGIDVADASILIKNNTISSNAVGIRASAASLTVNYNNLQSNQESGIRLENDTGDVDATNNWWGTTDSQAINTSIHDYKYEFGLGKVNFTPFLNEPAFEAVPEINANHSTSDIPEYTSFFVPLFLLASFVIVLRKKKLLRRNNFI